MPSYPILAHERQPAAGTTRLFFVIGSPVAQVQAPSAFNPLLARAGVDALVVALELPAGNLLPTCRALLDSASVGGLLVTVPYKQALFPLCDEVGTECAVARGVNAIRRSASGAVIGDLFDGVGFVRGLQASGHDPRARRVLLVGAGGAGSAVAVALAAAGVGFLRIVDRSPGRAAALRRAVGAHHPACKLEAVERADPSGCDIVINATPLGMRPDDPLPVDPTSFEAGTLVADVIMKPAETQLLKRARERGCEVHPGRPMLDHQLPSYLEFFGLPDAARLASEDLARRSRG